MGKAKKVSGVKLGPTGRRRKCTALTVKPLSRQKAMVIEVNAEAGKDYPVSLTLTKVDALRLASEICAVIRAHEEAEQSG